MLRQSHEIRLWGFHRTMRDSQTGHVIILPSMDLKQLAAKITKGNNYEKITVIANWSPALMTALSQIILEIHIFVYVVLSHTDPCSYSSNYLLMNKHIQTDCLLHAGYSSKILYVSESSKQNNSALPSWSLLLARSNQNIQIEKQIISCV